MSPGKEQLSLENDISTSEQQNFLCAAGDLKLYNSQLSHSMNIQKRIFFALVTNA